MRVQLLSLFLAVLLLLAPGWAEQAAGEGNLAVSISPASQGETLQLSVRVKTFIDGDTTHFVSVDDPGQVLKARYLAVDTPESTGKIEPWGKAASLFTRQRLENASHILLESDDGSWNLDSSGERILVWVWYREDGGPWRNLNVELLQMGLAIAYSSANNRYGETCMAAIRQARDLKKGVYSGEKDPDFYYGDAVEMTLKELRTHLRSYEGIQVAFEGVVTVNHDNSVFVEELDAETGLVFGIPVYYGYHLSGGGLEILRVGNRVRIVGKVQYYEAGDAWQVSGVTYRMMKPKDPNNLQKISEGHAPQWTVTDAKTLQEGTVLLPGEEGMEEFSLAFLAEGTTVTLEDVTVQGGYTSQNGAMTLFCTQGGTAVQLRTIPLKDESGQPLTHEALRGRVARVRGIVGHYNNETQIEVLTPDGLALR